MVKKQITYDIKIEAKKVLIQNTTCYMIFIVFIISLYLINYIISNV